jgi:hypothetical protein
MNKSQFLKSQRSYRFSGSERDMEMPNSDFRFHSQFTAEKLRLNQKEKKGVNVVSLLT